MLPGQKYTIEDILGILWRRKWLIVLPLLVCSAGTFLVVRRLPDMYRSETLILVVPQKVPESYVRSTVSGTIEDRLQSLQQQILSRSRLERIILDFDLYSEARKTRSMDSVIDSMRAAIKVDVVRGGEAFTVAYAARDALVAKKVTERLASLFIDENVHDRETLAIGTSEFLQTQLDDARRRLIEQERRVEEYRVKYAGQLPSQTGFNLQAVQNDRAQLQIIEAGLARARDRQLTLERQLADLLQADSPVAVASASASPPPANDDPLEPVGATAREQLADGRRKLAALENRGFLPTHPDVARLKRRIAQLEPKAAAEPAPSAHAPEPLDPNAAARERRAEEIRIDLESVKREIAAGELQQRRLQQEAADYQSRLDAAPIREAEMTELTRDYETMQEIYRGLLAKREDSKVAANLEQRQVGQQFRVLDPARVPGVPFSPNRLRLNLVGIAIGLALGLGVTGLLEYLDTTLKTEEHVRALLALPVLATIPVLEDPGTSRSMKTRVLAVLRG